MNYHDTERRLSRFKIKEPGPNLKYRVLLRAKNTWKESEETAIIRNVRFRLLRNYACVLASIVLLNAATSQVDIMLTGRIIDGKPIMANRFEEESGMKDLYASLGLDYKIKKLFVSMHQESEPGESSKTLLEQQRQLWKELAAPPQRG